ncbi:MAG: ABC transporter ATP-binding protein [Chloroflexales bacterium]|nr:ABC transporter ATP-binding protein [Chloroflexales bacterium]
MRPSALIQLQHLTRGLALIWRAAPRQTLAWAVLLVIQGLLPATTVWLSRPLVDGLAAAAQASGAWTSARALLPTAALLLGSLVLTELLQGLGGWVRAAQAEYVQDHISGLIQQKSVEVDLAFYESPEYHDHLHRARDDAASRPLALLEGAGSLMQNGITLLAMAAILLPYGAWLPPLLLLSTLPALLVLLRSSWRYHQWWRQSTANQRRAWYYEWLLTGSETAAELRLFGLGSSFQQSYQALRGQLRGERLGLLRKQMLAGLAANALGLLSAGGAVAWMVWRVLQGLVTLGDLALFFQAFQRGQGLLRALLADAGQIYANSLFLGGLFAFLALKPEVADPPAPTTAPAPLREGVTFRDVTFRYPGSGHDSLKSFNLTIPAGRIVAIVGANGAGKSTLVKLLCRFYDPQQGRVELDGVDLRDLALDDLRRQITVLFQAPVEYQATAAENISLGDPAAGAEREAVVRAAQAAGAHELVERLPAGYDTQLGKWFTDGAELSGGEWQRVALARAFLRQAPIIALDEPTSHMDSWGEADWFERVRRLAAGRTLLIITHRFTVAMRADVIHVMDQGQIVESGSHNDLVELDGSYAAAWAEQMSGGYVGARLV